MIQDLKDKKIELDINLQILFEKHNTNRLILKNKYVLSPDYSDYLKGEQKKIKKEVEGVQRDIRLTENFINKYQ